MHDERAEVALHAHGIAKSFQGIRALGGVSLSLKAGTITALLGENGAGKSTLVKILTGVDQPDRGRIVVAGCERRFASPRDAWAAGIAAIHQETVMFDDLTVAENIFVGHWPRSRRGGIDWAAIRARARAALDRLEADIDIKAPMKQLGVAQKHLVEIARALSHDARIVIMDEPTASLSAREIDDLFRIALQLKAEGRALLFISHKFDEIFRLCDRWSCLRDGEEVGAGAIADVGEAALVRLMVGRPIEAVFPKRPVPIGETVLAVEDLSNATEYDGLSFSVRRGEILGLYGLVGAGRSEAMQALFGLSAPTRGRVQLDGKPVALRNPAEAIAAGLAYVPEDRQREGIVTALTIRDNIALAALPALGAGPFMAKSRERALTRRLAGRLAVRASHYDQRAGELSGGNQQKVVIAKWLATHPRLIILDEPTKGIDVGSKAAVHDFMVELAGDGLAVILVSSELPEVMGMADRIIVMREGRSVAEFARADFRAETIVAAATGAATKKWTA